MDITAKITFHINVRKYMQANTGFMKEQLKIVI